MKIALIGYGNMGQMIEKVAESRGHTIVARLSSVPWDVAAVQEADVCMEFTQAACVLENVQRLAALKKAIIIGTTGWYDHLSWMNTLVKEQEIGVLYSPNFSLGVQLLFAILTKAAQLMNNFGEYDVAGIEYHHNQKKDAPSGTARELAKIIEANMQRTDKMPFSSIRCGAIPGIHTILFDSPYDTITLSHEARNREGFAHGAIQAAEWLQGRKGLYTFADCIRTTLYEEKL
jgi:4-hydroxy-tetrahydrodipicolinate reductase